MCHCPTPLESLERIRNIRRGPGIWIKPNDCKELATGGNKKRKLELLVGYALNKLLDTLATQGLVKSKHTKEYATTAKFGLKCHIILESRIPVTNDAYEITGNVF